jgi:hypothetical protein
VVAEIGRAAAALAGSRVGALIVIERETGLEDFAETGVMIHADLHADLLRTIFTPHAPLHDGAVLIRGEKVIAAAVVLPLSETSVHRERFGTRHRAALGRDRADGRDRGRGQRGERRDQPRRARPDPSRAGRGAAPDGAARAAEARRSTRTRRARQPSRSATVSGVACGSAAHGVAA